jgi:hypothetical protein
MRIGGSSKIVFTAKGVAFALWLRLGIVGTMPARGGRFFKADEAG